MNSKFYYWQEINSIPISASGIYAWYFTPELSERDLDDILKSLKASSRTESVAELESFLSTAVFDFFTETPYKAIIKGPLKAGYVGELMHESRVSPSMLDRLVDNPERLRLIKEVLLASSPNFSSPLYIGMAKSLGTRLKKHKSLIDSYRSGGQGVVHGDDGDSTLVRDQSFAREVVERKIPSSGLRVYTSEMEVTERMPDVYKDIENILNRIHFPLFGKN